MALLWCRTMGSDSLPHHQMQAVINYLRGSVATIFIKSGVPDVGGSGWFLSAAGSVFIVTASHVAKRMSNGFGVASLSRPGVPVDIGETRAYISPDEEEEKQDVAAFELIEKEKADQVCALWNVLVPSDLLHDTSPKGIYIVAGAPLGRMRKKEEGRLVGKFLQIVCSTYRGNDRSTLAPDTFRLSFDQKWKTVGGAENKAGRLDGLSGCPVWKVRDDEKEQLWSAGCQLRIVGIQVACKHDEYIVVHGIRLVAEAITKLNAQAGKELFSGLKLEGASS